MVNGEDVINVAHQTLLSNRGVMTRTSQKVSYRQALLNACLQEVVNLCEAREACGEGVREKGDCWQDECLQTLRRDHSHSQSCQSVADIKQKYRSFHPQTSKINSQPGKPLFFFHFIPHPSK